MTRRARSNRGEKSELAFRRVYTYVSAQSSSSTASPTLTVPGSMTSA